MLYVCLMYALLGSEVHEEREIGERELIRLVHRTPEYGPIIGQWYGQATSGEVKRRALNVVRVWQNRRAVYYVPPVPFWPQCDMYPVRILGCDIRDRSLGLRTWQVDIPDVPPNPRANSPCYYWFRNTTERRVREMLLRGASYAECDALMVRMWTIEIRHQSDCNTVLPSGQWRGGYPANNEGK